jgi:mRNA interferase HigB
MHVITRKRLNEFADKHPESRSSLALVSTGKAQQLLEFRGLRETFPSADQVGKLTIFNIGGNKVRRIAAIHYNRKRIYIRAVLTHPKYDEQRWRK